MSQYFSPITPLEKLIHSGDRDATLAFLRPLTVAERGRHRAQLVRMIKLMTESRWKSPRDGSLHWGSTSSPEQERAAGAAILLCGTAEDVADAWIKVEDIIALSSEFDLPCLPALANAMLQKTPNTIDAVQRLLVTGLITRPDSDSYVLGLIALPRVRRRDADVRDYFAADPGLVQAVLRMFDIEGTGETSLASIDKYNSPENAWSYYLLSMCRDGVYERSMLLDKTLSALERDWPQYRSGWFSRFHTELAPTVPELQVNAARYLQLCHSRIPPTVSLALDALSALEASGVTNPAATLAALRPVMAAGSKGQVESAIKLLDRCVAREPGLETEAALVACAGLVHEAAPLQSKILQCLAKRPLQDQVRNELRRYLPGIAASNQKAMLRLIGEDEAPPAITKIATVETPIKASVRAMPLDEDRRLAPIADIDELIQTIAYVYENDTCIDEFERTLEALVVAAPIAATDRVRFGPVLKRAGKLRKPVALELARLLTFVLEGKRLSAMPVVDQNGKPSEVHIRLIARIDALMDLAAQGKRVPPLSAPTHRRGFIGPADLIARVKSDQQHPVQHSAGEQVLALLRLAPTATDTDRQQARTLVDTPFARALRYALGDDVVPGKERALFCSAARMRHPQADDAVLLNAYGDLGPDGPLAARYTWEVTSRRLGNEKSLLHELHVHTAKRAADVGDLLAIARHARPVEQLSWGAYRLIRLAGDDPALVAYSANLLPRDLEAFFAEGVRALGNNLDWWEAQWQNKVYLGPLLDPTVLPGPMATLMLACALAGKEPGQTALAVDGLVRMHSEARLDVSMLSATMQRLLATPFVKAARYRKSLDAALRIDPDLGPTIIDLLSACLPFNAIPPPKDIAQLLELLHELLISTGRSLSPNVKQSIAKMQLSGNGKSIQKKLLAI